jgi:hypothetical protein
MFAKIGISPSLAMSFLLGLFGRAEAGIVTARSASLADVSAAVASATDGDTVAVPAGMATWTSDLTISKAITLQGAGIGKTIILEDLSTDQPMLSFNTAMGKFYRLSGFEFRRGTRTRKFGKGCVLVYGTTRTFRLDHCKFDSLNNRATYFRNAVCGVLDHNVFISRRSTQITIFHDAWDGKSFGDGSWATPLDWGGPNAIYIEDNDFSTDPPNPTGVIDEYAGARFVFRHNKVTNAIIASHGTGSTGRNRGVRQWEIYDNTLIAKPSTPKNAIHMRGGTGVVFNNTLTGFTKFVTLHTYRYHTAFRMWGGSDSTSGWDLNDPKVYASGIAGPGSGIGPNDTGGKLVVPGAGWSTNQWVGYTIRNLDGLSNIQPVRTKGGDGKITRRSETEEHSGEEAEQDEGGDRPKQIRRSERDRPGPFFSTIVSNTADTIIARAGSQRPNKIFAPGDRFEIRRVIQGLDMIGASTGDLLSDGEGRQHSPDLSFPNQRNKREEGTGGRGTARGRGMNPGRARAVAEPREQGKKGAYPLTPKWLNQTIEPVYVWNNTKDGVENAGVAIANPPIKEGVHFFNNKPKPGYKPFVYPHPLVTADSKDLSGPRQFPPATQPPDSTGQ